ncbi:MAG: YggS family pyridoxal phosphate-dependent enzyme [bacterium]
MSVNLIEDRVAAFLNTLPPEVLLVAAAKTRTVAEVQAAIRAGVQIIGYNYVQEAEKMRQMVAVPVQWHMIGHLQRNKAKKAIQLFDMIETLDSLRLAEALNRLCAESDVILPVLVEINSGREQNKTGVFPEDVPDFVLKISELANLKVQGLMTMGTFSPNPEDSRPYFQATKAVFDRLTEANIPNVEMRYLSMGMSSSYQVALEEGANIVRIGTHLFGARPY